MVCREGQGPRHGAVAFSDLRRVGWLLSLAQGPGALCSRLFRWELHSARYGLYRRGMAEHAPARFGVAWLVRRGMAWNKFFAARYGMAVTGKARFGRVLTSRKYDGNSKD